jgi:hypothetical protein
MTKEKRNKKVLEAIASHTKSAVRTKAAARASLIREGIYTEAGKLTVSFGGTAKKKRSAA